MILELADGTPVSGTVSVKGGYLCIQIGGWLGMEEILLRPQPAIRVCGRILEILDPKGTRLPAAKEPATR